MSRMDCLPVDLSSKILLCLDDVADLIRASAVSWSWRNLVISSFLSKKLCLQRFPWLDYIASMVEENDGIQEKFAVVSRNPIDLERLEREHKIYICLLKVLDTPVVSPKECLALPIGVSSTDNDVENIINTLNPEDRHSSVGIYWSSTGQIDPDVPEHILYLLKNPTCIVTEIVIRPFEVFWEPGCPVYSAKSVRFRMGHPKSVEDLEITGNKICPSQLPSLDKYVWTYTSPVFPMAQEACLQRFKLPEPAICMGGYLHIELLGRAQREEIDGLFYIGLGYVSVIGNTLEPAFNFDMTLSGEVQLKYCPYGVGMVLESFSNDSLQIPCRFSYMTREEEDEDGGDEYLMEVIHQVINNRYRDIVAEAEEEDDEEMA